MNSFVCCLKVGRAGTVHRQFQRLLTELNKPTNAYELSVANRLYGDKEVSFSQVSFMARRISGLGTGASVPGPPHGGRGGS